MTATQQDDYRRINEDAASEGLWRLIHLCHEDSVNAGWWDGIDLGPDMATLGDLNVIGTKLALIHSEVSEALEGVRTSSLDDHLPHRPMFEVELADAIIRICDLAGACQLNLADAVIEKLTYNRQRADHKRDHRAAQGGKKI